MSKHTPGPWEVHTAAVNFATTPRESEIRGGNHVVVRLGVMHHETAQANARLIAAAPDLLAALQLIANFSNEDVSDMVRDIARAAIAKAEGKP